MPHSTDHFQWEDDSYYFRYKDSKVEYSSTGLTWRPCPDAEGVAFRMGMKYQEQLMQLPPQPAFKIGDVVRIISPEFQGRAGVVGELFNIDELPIAVVLSLNGESLTTLNFDAKELERIDLDERVNCCG